MIDFADERGVENEWSGGQVSTGAIKAPSGASENFVDEVEQIQ